MLLQCFTYRDVRSSPPRRAMTNIHSYLYTQGRRFGRVWRTEYGGVAGGAVRLRGLQTAVI